VTFRPHSTALISIEGNLIAVGRFLHIANAVAYGEASKPEATALS
jgi:hypothetical protein